MFRKICVSLRMTISLMFHGMRQPMQKNMLYALKKWTAAEIQRILIIPRVSSQLITVFNIRYMYMQLTETALQIMMI